MVKVTLIIPIFSKDDAEEKRRFQNASKWFFEYKTTETLRSLGLTRDDFDLKVIGRKIPIRNGNLTLTPDGMVGKGSIVGHAIFASNMFPDRYIICIDGDGQINFENAFSIISELNKGEEAIFSCRANRYGISEERKIVELFETFILSEIFGIELPDTQCGCWGFKASLMPQKQISICAKDFELELDLLSSLLMANIIPTFYYVEVSSSTQTNFREEDHINKMKFVCNKLRIDKFKIESFIEKFEKMKKLLLPEAYKKAVLDHIPENYDKKVIKCCRCNQKHNNPNCPFK